MSWYGAQYPAGKHNNSGEKQMTDATQDLAAHYADAIEFERTAWHALQAYAPGSRDRAQAWATWSEAISRTNHAWRQLSCHTLSKPRHGAEALTDVRPHLHPGSTPPHRGH